MLMVRGRYRKDSSIIFSFRNVKVLHNIYNVHVHMCTCICLKYTMYAYTCTCTYMYMYMYVIEYKGSCLLNVNGGVGVFVRGILP